MENVILLTATVVTALVADAGTGGEASAAAAGFWTVTAGQLIPLVAAIIAAGGVAATLLANAANTRRQNLTTLYGDALGAVSEYLEGPYRILRKDGEAATRFTITGNLSDVKTSIDHHQALLRLHADPVVADAYDHYVTIAKTEAGEQMHHAWKAPPVTRDEGVNLHVSLPRDASNNARKVVVEAMQAHLRYRRRNVATRDRFKKAKSDVNEAIRQYDIDKQAETTRKAEARLAADAAHQARLSRPPARSRLSRLARGLRQRADSTSSAKGS